MTLQISGTGTSTDAVVMCFTVQHGFAGTRIVQVELKRSLASLQVQRRYRKCQKAGLQLFPAFFRLVMQLASSSCQMQVFVKLAGFAFRVGKDRA